MFNIGEDIRYTKVVQNEKSHILTGTSYNEGMNSNLRLESGEEIINHATHMARLDYSDISSIPTNIQNFQEQMKYISKEDAELLTRPTKLSALQYKLLTCNEQFNLLYFHKCFS